MCASALVVNDNVFHKVLTLSTHKMFLDKKNTHWKVLCVCTSVPHRFNHFSLFFDNLGTERMGGIIKLGANVNMILNFLIIDKSIVAERSSVPLQLSKCSTTSAFSSKILVLKGKEKLG